MTHSISPRNKQSSGSIGKDRDLHRVTFKLLLLNKRLRSQNEQLKRENFHLQVRVKECGPLESAKTTEMMEKLHHLATNHHFLTFLNNCVDSTQNPMYNVGQEDKNLDNHSLDEQNKSAAKEKNYQAIIDERALNDSSIESRGLDDGIDHIRPRDTREQFDELMSSISDLQSLIVQQLDSSCQSFEKKRRKIYSRLVDSLFDPGIWKVLNSAMTRTKMTKHCVVKLIHQQRGGMTNDKDNQLDYLASHIEHYLIRLIEDEFGQEAPGEIKESIRECSALSIRLACYLIMCKPKMGMIMPKRGDLFNSDKHENASYECDVIVQSLKRPGLVCISDNRVFTRALVESELRKITV